MHYPRILTYSSEALTNTHGTGTIFERNFSNYPKNHIFNICFRDSTNPLIPNRFSLSTTSAFTSSVGTLSNRIKYKLNKLTAPLWGRTLLASFDEEDLGLTIRNNIPATDILYSICHNIRDFLLTRLIHQELAPKTPLIVHIHDFFPNAHFAFWKNLNELSPHVTEFWIVSEAIANSIRK